ncbi:membrane cofactor protein-like isoform X2 [Pseudoliparis swirei]|nr:membrane cofactor protein-like isoform X2 [Pseudoliparis swirei]
MGVTYILLLSSLGFAIHTRAQDCLAPVAGDNMGLQDNFKDLKTFQNGLKVSFACNDTYKSVGGSPNIICTNGSWSPLRLKCERNNCGSAGDVADGNIDYSEGTEFGNKLVVTCKKGYYMIGASQIFCGPEGWLKRLPVCEVVICYPPSSSDVVTFRPIKETYEFREVVQYTCQKDYTLSGSISLACSENGTFQPNPPTCVMVQCKDPDIDNGKWVSGSRRPYTYKSVVTLECLSGYTMTGEPIQTCEMDSRWLPGLPTCEQIPTTTHPATKKTIVDVGPTDSPGNNGHRAFKIWLGIGLTVFIGIVLTFCGCYWCGVPAIIKRKRRSRGRSPGNVVPKEEEVALA